MSKSYTFFKQCFLFYFKSLKGISKYKINNVVLIFKL